MCNALIHSLASNEVPGTMLGTGASRASQATVPVSWGRGEGEGEGVGQVRE